MGRRPPRALSQPLPQASSGCSSSTARTSRRTSATPWAWWPRPCTSYSRRRTSPTRRGAAWATPTSGRPGRSSRGGRASGRGRPSGWAGTFSEVGSAPSEGVGRLFQSGQGRSLWAGLFFQRWAGPLSGVGVSDPSEAGGGHSSRWAGPLRLRGWGRPSRVGGPPFRNPKESLQPSVLRLQTQSPSPLLSAPT